MVAVDWISIGRPGGSGLLVKVSCISIWRSRKDGLIAQVGILCSTLSISSRRALSAGRGFTWYIQEGQFAGRGW
jgi:hypothetical protein